VSQETGSQFHSSDRLSTQQAKLYTEET